MTLEAAVEANALRSLVETVTSIVDECKLVSTDDGLEVTAVDSANVAMVKTGLSADSMESYSTSGTTLGVNLEALEDVVSLASSDSIIHLSLVDQESKLYLEFEDLSYTLALLDPDSVREEPDIPDLSLDCEVVLESDDLTRAVTAADMVAEHLELQFSEGVSENEDTEEDEAEPDEEDGNRTEAGDEGGNETQAGGEDRSETEAGGEDRSETEAVGEDESGGKDEFIVTASGDTDDVELSMDEDEVISLTASDASSLFANNYLETVTDVIPAGSEVLVKNDDNMPIMIQFDPTGEEVEPVSDDLEYNTLFVIAPRID